ncbi:MULTISPECIES: hypothetical protein [Actinomadura]|uniref:Uncharacterized protein n=1 Tax=Actinomadura yumaensis TaxID=111807 RepID=A0ABW2CK08_9ACTN|nr:hypothetical protein [Actinomadura sp. J1-007]MWK38690.1 hypothetical protein [Actinomadura sp. J1-007]
MAGDDLIAVADRIIRRELRVEEGASARTAAFLLRLALEREIDAYWESIGLGPVADNPMRPQLLCLAEYADAAVAARASSLWGQLSQACHYHAYELAPTSRELRRWHTEVSRLSARLRERRETTPAEG